VLLWSAQCNRVEQNSKYSVEQRLEGVDDVLEIYRMVKKIVWNTMYVFFVFDRGQLPAKMSLRAPAPRDMNA
jgi:hypothetical protein